MTSLVEHYIWELENCCLEYEEDIGGPSETIWEMKWYNAAHKQFISPLGINVMSSYWKNNNPHPSGEGE